MLAHQYTHVHISTHSRMQRYTHKLIQTHTHNIYTYSKKLNVRALTHTQAHTHARTHSYTLKQIYA